MRRSSPIAPSPAPVGARLARAARLRAFTLIELLVAAAITALLSGFIFIIVHNVSTTWTRSTGRLGADAQARLVLDQLALDLQGAMFRDDGNVWMAANIVDNATNAGTLWTEASRNPKPSGTGANSSLNLTTPGIGDPLARFGKAGVWLRFFTTSRGSNTATSPATVSAPVAVGYQILRRFTATNTVNQNTGYLLHRAEARPATVNSRVGVLESGYNLDPNPKLPTNYTRSNLNGVRNDGATTGDPRSIQVPGSNTGAGGRNLDSVLADNVIDLGIRCYVRDAATPGGLRLIFPVDAAGKLGGNSATRLISSVPATTSVPTANLNTLFPDVVDVMIRVLTDDGAQQIANMEKNQTPALTVPVKYNGSPQQWWWGVAQENSRVYTRRIVLNAKSL